MIISLYIFVFLSINFGVCQEDRKGTSPSLFDVAQWKFVYTTAPHSTCGHPTPTQYCRAVDSEEDMMGGACNFAQCNQKCPGRDRDDDAQPKPIELLDADPGPCVTPDFKNYRKGGSQPSYRFHKERGCGLTPGSVPRLGRYGQFTISVWIKQEASNSGVIFEKAAFLGGNVPVVILTIMVGSNSLIMQYLGLLDKRPHVQAFDAPLPSGKWCHLAIQVINTDISIYVDEEKVESEMWTPESGSPLLTGKLENPIFDINVAPTIRIGHRVRGTNQFVGWMQDFRWYNLDLTNREIQELLTGEFKELNIQSNCLCPPGFPRIHPLDERYCLPNGVADTDASLRRLRLNPNAHPLAFILDGDSSTTWISRPDIYMPGGLTLVIDLKNGEYEVFYVSIYFYNAQPKSISISRNSSATGGLFEPWGNFADDCMQRFGINSEEPLYQPDSETCQEFPMDVPYKDGNVTFDLIPAEPIARPGHDDFYATPLLMDFVKAKQIQIRFTYQYFTAVEDLNSGHIYYGVKGIQVIGRCNCHGHALTCDSNKNPYQCKCLEESNTEGHMCQRCKPLFNNKAFRIGDNESAYNCRRCECNSHAESCSYDQELDPYPDDFFRGGGGVCMDCKHNTVGRFCERCKPKFYRTPETSLNSKSACSPCRCRRAGVINQTMECAQDGGQCLCKAKVTSRRCKDCMEGYYNMNLDNEEGCEECQCHLAGTVNRSISCQQVGGQCHCKLNVRNRTCSQCEYTYKNLSDANPEGCERCNCNEVGATSQHCNPVSGQCFCKDNVEGLFCDQCEDGYWGLSSSGCRPCDCDPAGSEPSTICNKQTGQCVCKANTQGRACSECKDEFYNLDSYNVQGCSSCGCDARGTINSSLVCDKMDGRCSCKRNVEGRVCNLCKGNTFGLREKLDIGCEACNCDPMGTSLGQELDPHELVCDSNHGQCACLSSREGRRCDQCSPGFYLPPSNETGCLVCDCHPVGSTSQVCDNVTGMCPCKPLESGAGLAGRRCDQCNRTFWNFHDLFGTCEPCGCDEAGSETDECNVVTGQCSCKGNVMGLQCDTCRPGSSQLSSANPMGCYSHPEQQAAPLESNLKSRQVSLTWNPPDYPNGEVLTYKLFRNKEIIYNLTDNSPFESYTYNDTGLLPYTDYEYFIETTNIGGSVYSPTLRVKTLAGIPTGIPPLLVSDIRAHEATFEWGEPEVAHGPIETYVLQSVSSTEDDLIQVHYRGKLTRASVQRLSAFSNYTFTLRACTSGGCGDSRPLNVLTPEAKPAKQSPPVVTALSNTSLQISWNPPEEANGIIRKYELMMRGKPGPDGVHRPLQRRVFQSFGSYNPRPFSSTPINPLVSNFTQENLQPFSQYEFLVSSSNRLGSVESSWATGRTLEGVPVFMPPPTLEPLSSFEVNITWPTPDPVTEARGDVMMYQVILTRNNTSGNPFAPPTEDVVIYSCPPGTHGFVATGFNPYSSHKISINLCNSISCVRSEARNTTTLPAAPEAQSPPVAWWSEPFLNITWKDPGRINGPRPLFMLMRSNVAFSDPPIEMTRGVRFPGLSYVRFPPFIAPRDASYTGIELWFRTFESDSLLYFSASALSSNGVREEYVVLQLRGGRPWFLFDAQNNPTAVTVDNDQSKKYNDGLWHRLEANRFNRDGFLEVDGVYTGRNTSNGVTTVVGANDGVYIGGLPIDYDVARPNDVNEQAVIRRSLIGCIKDIRVQRNTALGEWSNVTWDESDQWHRAYQSWEGCPIDLDRPGVHFLGKGYLEVPSDALPAMVVGNWEVKLSIRTQFTSGILFYIKGSGNDVLISTVTDGRVRLIFRSGVDQLTDLTATANNQSFDYYLCDGNWHDLTLRSWNNRMSIEVDDVTHANASTTPVMSYSKLEPPLYVGGIPHHMISSLVSFVEDAQSFGGCMRGVEINGYVISLSRDVNMAINVDLDGCPRGALNSDLSRETSSGSGDEDYIFSSTGTASLLNVTCKDNNISVLYSGMKHYYADHDVINASYTRYLYKVASSNAGGEAQSEWMVARSKEGIPLVVSAPFNEESLSGREVRMEWKRPENARGVIVNYTLAADQVKFGERNVTSQYYAAISSSNVAMAITATFPGDASKGTLTGLSPWTTYSVSLTACTRAGCQQSMARTEVTTLEEIPQDVEPPFADVNATTMMIRWAAPQSPNGRILRYLLYHNGSEVYEGQQTYLYIPDLPIFTAQKFRLEACTTIGCNSSKEVTLYSGQLPPSHMDQPMVSVEGPHTVSIRWLKPAIMNGVFTRYVIYLRDVDREAPGDVIYNSTNSFLHYTLDNLIAGTLYYVTIAACTEGGCRMSTATPCQTSESIPEKIPPPIVQSFDPHTFVITWLAPQLPNGMVKVYNIYQDGKQVYNASAPSSTTITGFLPWSRHEFKVEVCTNKGCAFGPEVRQRTKQSPPEGDVELSVAVLGPRTLQARWGKPQRSNGRISYSVICVGLFYANPGVGNYHTNRESRVMLNSTTTWEWMTVRGLLPFSEYIVKVNASNDAGYVISNMRTVSMPPGAPDGVIKPSVISHSPFSILASWKDPARNNAKGNPLFQLQYRAVFPQENERNAFDYATRQMSFELKDLSPYTTYEFQLIASNEYGDTKSGWLAATTMQDRPSFLDPPIIFEIDAWTLLVTWNPPSTPNGIIVSYNLYQNNKLRQSLPGNVTQYDADFLTPFSSYGFKIEACTEAGCVMSNESRRIRTSASAPEGLEPPVVRSDTPASVFVRWSAPRFTNGILNNYRLERRKNGTDKKPELLGVFVPSQSLRYLDEGDQLTPYTSYQYRVICSTLGGGTTISSWATVTTRPGRPGGVLAPRVLITGSESALVNWETPLHTHGPIVSYELLFPEPRVQISNVTLRSTNISELIPFTDYQVKLVACTTGGCTESPSTHARTLADVPRGLAPPIATPISERVINVQWSSPKFPNGPDVYYELSRTILDQPLDPSPSPFVNITRTIYTGKNLIFQDRALDKFTTYEYRLSVFNSEGSLASNGTIVTSQAGYPTSEVKLNVAVHNHTAVYLWWETPTIHQLQGSVVGYTINYNSSTSNGEVDFLPSTTSWKLNRLLPSTTYQFALSVDNGAHIVTSQPVYATTDDGAPRGVRLPVVYPLSPSELRVSWLSPDEPNGKIVAYNIIIDGVTIHTNLSYTSAYVVDGLRPYTIYTLKLEACTVYACALSNATQATTKETIPSEMAAPTIELMRSRNVDVSWKDPALPNGILKSYQVYRRMIVSCNKIDPDSSDEKCEYVRCDVGQKVCGSTCYLPTQKVCCGEILYDVSSTNECCGQNYISVREHPSDVCCGGQFYSYAENRQCCAEKYVKVGRNEVCCADSTEDRVVVGAGDSCCQGIPFFDDGLQICCGDTLHDGYKKKCCGGKILNDKQICCGNPKKGVAYDVISSKKCCGAQYLSRNTTICCYGNNEHKAYYYDNMTSSNMKCCGSNLISLEERCCHGVGYDSYEGVCADVATASLSDTSIPPSCGSGTVCPLDRAMYAACDRCDVDREKFDCFRTRLLPHTSSGGGPNEKCPTPFINIYSGPPHVHSFYDADLEYHVTYEYKVVAENKVGAADSDPAYVTTHQSVPEYVAAPDWQAENRNTIKLSWKAPEKPNGVIRRYTLMRDGLEIWTGLAFRHTDSYQVVSYREYKYVLKACTVIGCTSSNPVRATSIQGTPESLLPPRITVKGPKSISILWIPPSRSNGVIQRYLLNETSLGIIHTTTNTSQSELQFVNEQLKPYTLYTYVVTACTSLGCTSSPEVSARTSEDLPQGVWFRSALLPLNSTSVELLWTRPRHPNGVILEYRMMRRVIGNMVNSSIDKETIYDLPWQLAYDGNGDAFSFVDHVAKPGATLQYKLIVINGAGNAVSEVKQTQLPVVVPIEYPIVSAQPLSPISVHVNWTFESDVINVLRFRFQVVLHQVVAGFQPKATTTVTTPARHKRETERAVSDGVVASVSDDDLALIKFVSAGTNQSLTIDNLKPYTEYQVRVQTCLINSSQPESCNVGSSDQIRTFSSLPEGLVAPIAKSHSPTSVKVTWTAPQFANGVIVAYRVYRRVEEVAFEELVMFTTDPSVRSFTDSDLRPFTLYHYQVRVSNSKGEVASGWVKVITEQGIPEDFFAPYVEAVSAFAVKARWSPPRQPNGIIASYRLEYQQVTIDPTAFPSIFPALSTPSTVHEVVFSGLRPFTKYRVRVVAVNQIMKEGLSGWEEVMTLSAPPSEVANLTAVPVSDGKSLLLSWEEPTVPNGKIQTYNIYEVGYEDIPLYSGLSRQFHFRRLSPYTEYHLILEACTGRETCTRSLPSTVRTAETAPENQSPPQLTTRNATAILITWSKPTRANGRVISYQVIRKDLPKSIQLGRQREKRSTSKKMSWDRDVLKVSTLAYSVERVRRQSDSYAFSGSGKVVFEILNPVSESYNYSDVHLTPFTRYGYRIQTSTRAGSVESDWVYTETHQGPPDDVRPPQVQQPADKNPTTLVVTWERPGRINGDLQTFQLERNNSTPLSFPPTQFQHYDQDLQPFTFYSYRITACSAGGCTTSDVTIMRTYEEAPLYMAPPSVASLNSSAIKAEWEIPEISNGIIKKYRLHVGDVLRYEGIATSAVVGGLGAYRVYDVTIEACTSSGCRESDVTKVKTGEAPPSGMAVPEVHVTSSNSIEIIWNPPLHPNGEIVRYEVHRDDELVLVNNGGATRYHDFGLAAGTEYYYVITAFNNVGSIHSNPPVSATTNPSAPAGLTPPTLSVTSSSSIKAEWEAPIKPNGKILNYTLSVRQKPGSDVKEYNFTGPVYSFHVRGLEFYTRYLFWVRACTVLGCVTSERVMQQTMEAPPANQMAPRVSASFYNSLSMMVSWYPPSRSNGKILRYIIRRRRILFTPSNPETVEAEIIANQTEESFVDGDLLPYTQYQYQVVSFNSAGEAPSPWSPAIRSGEAAPHNVPAPTFGNIRSRSVFVSCGKPESANGILRYYHVFLKKNGSSEAMRKVSTSALPDITISNLIPSTIYNVLVEMCTLETLCTRGKETFFTTKSAPPNGQAPPQLRFIASNNASLMWNEPEQKNGMIERYELRLRKMCPPSSQPFNQTCVIGPTQLAYMGTNREVVVGGLSPYTNYAFSVTSYNKHGKSESAWEPATTDKAEPTYDVKFSAVRNISAIEVSWANCFNLNGVLQRYELLDNGAIIYAGIATTYHLRRTSSRVHEFQIILHTDTGTVQSPTFVYDTTKKDNGLVMKRDDVNLTTVPVPFYQSMWFILVVSLAAMVVTVVILTAFIQKRGRKLPNSDMTEVNFPKSGTARSRDTEGLSFGMSELGPFNSDESLHSYSVQSYSVKAHDAITDKGNFNRSFSADSVNRSTSQLIDHETYFGQSEIYGKNDLLYDQWQGDNQRTFEEADKNEQFLDEHQAAPADSGMVSRRRYPSHKTKANESEQKSHYFEADDISFDDLASDVTLVRWSEKLRDLPRKTSLGGGKWKSSDRSKAPMPVTFYKKNKEPFTII